MAFVTEEQVRREQITGLVTCSRCGEEGLIWDRTNEGKPWLYDVKQANASEELKYQADAETVPWARQTKENGLVLVLKYRPHRCSASFLPDGTPIRVFATQDEDRPHDLETSDADEVMGLVLTEEV